VQIDVDAVTTEKLLSYIPIVRKTCWTKEAWIISTDRKGGCAEYSVFIVIVDSCQDTEGAWRKKIILGSLAKQMVRIAC